MSGNSYFQMRRVAILAILLLLLAVGLTQQQAIGDWFRLRGYTPSSEVAALAQSDGFTAKSRHLFYINRPEIVAKNQFTTKCSNGQTEQTIVLGCYHGVQAGIYVLRITNDPRLDGVMQVTAAHEMLHAAYDRLSNQERTQVDGWLQDYYEHDLTNERIKKTIEAYKKTEPNDLPNEMHSVFGTEAENLPPQLEHYYSRYFTDRQHVVALANGYQQAFTSREKQVAAYDAQLKELKQKINDNEAALNSQAANLKAEATEMDHLKSSGQAAAYNAKVDDYNRRVNEYNSLIAATKGQISDYNRLVSRRNAVALEQRQLVKELGGDGITPIHQ